ncbi:polysaccharide biosynthesis tyrosine autokinase [Maribacter algarum]|uniref:non-specific protein-tyrosine kinase n=1 Tax=Maribacter algarum (ex Zhang et al. 2020) TaxID=2578118 RepID=A0A5S3PHL8_9FLAO|nr:tyrosine-protein kinase [Maribacter algarum]TMM53775.1 polysaccharide biosynthesis tyrosine autokinase [Maribacter algarum]
MNLDSQNPTDKNIDLKEVISGYTKYWKWFVFSGILALILASVYIRYTTPQYAAAAKIQILEDENSSSGLSAFSDLDVLGGGKNKVIDEIELIGSRSNFIDVVKELRLNTKIRVLGNVISTELYNNPPINLNFIAEDSTVNNANFDFYITLSSSTTFGYSEEEDKPVKVYSFGKNISTPMGDIVITPNIESFDKYKDEKLQVSVRPVDMVALGYRSKMNIVNSDDKSNIVDISLEDPIKEKAINIVNSLIKVYNESAVKDKQIIADKTSKFIDDRIAAIYGSLSNVDQDAQDFKTGQGVVDIPVETNINLSAGVANQQELAAARNQLNMAASMSNLVDSQKGYEVLPANLGDPATNSAIAQYNKLVSERKRLLESSNEKNPIIVNLDQQLDGLKGSLSSSLKSTVDNYSLTVNSLSGQQARFNSKVYSSPKNERALREITRKQQTTEQLYLYLLTKREESQIAVASKEPKSKTIDSGYSVSRFPVSPRKNLVYLASLIFGLLIPFSVIYGKDLLDTKVHNMNSLEKLTTDTPVLGEIPKLSSKEDKLVIKEDRSVLAESLRIIRTNLDYLIKTKMSKEGKNNVIFVTSSVPGEGKTFLSTNLSMILASTNKKVLLIGADIRNPKIYTFFTGSNVDKMSKPSRNKDAGLTEYLYDNTLNTKDIINPMLVHHNTIDVVYSGRIPPNPAELLMSDRMKELFDEVSDKYDYVIVDTAPLMVVTDTLLISQYANHMIYVTRAGVTENKAVGYPLKLQEEGKIKGLCFVVNDVKNSDLGYGGKYGYGYGKSQKKWWKF